jgi:hypothetical protein
MWHDGEVMPEDMNAHLHECMFYAVHEVLYPEDSRSAGYVICLIHCD